MPLFFGVAGCFLALLLPLSSRMGTDAAWKEGLIFALLGSGVNLLVLWCIRRYPTRVGIVGYGLLIGLLAAVAFAFADDYCLRLWVSSEPDHLRVLDKTFLNRLFIAFALSLPIAIIAAANKRFNELETRFSRQSGAEHLLKEAELFKLRQQLQPHFLYNSLNAINSLILIDTDKAQQMTGKLSDFLRASVRRDSNEVLPVAAELDYLEDYLSIESVRFGERLQVIYHKGELQDARLPPFLLQPLIENAIKFGLNGQTGKVIIQVTIYLVERMLVMTIENPFDPLSTPPAGTGFGLKGIRRRLFLLYGRDDLMHTVATETTFKAILKIPQLHVQSTAD